MSIITSTLDRDKMYEDSKGQNYQWNDSISMISLCSWWYQQISLSYSKNISDVKKGEPKKVKVTERLKNVKSLWGQEEKIDQQGCVELQHTKQVK